MYNIAKLFVTFFYVGYSKIIPGTIGTLLSIFILFLSYNFFEKFYLYLFFLIIFLLSLFLINIYQKKSIMKDPPEIVIDEFLGIYVFFLFIDQFNKFNIYLLLLLGFIFFRLFDILKPFPIGLIDKKIKNSFGVILDDILAGLYTVISLKILNEFI